MKKLIPILLTLMNISCNSIPAQPGAIQTGAAQTGKYLPVLEGKTIAIVANQTSMIGETHLVDSLLTLQDQYHFKISHVFAPEHGFRGNVDDGQWIDDERDPETGIPLVSVYGKNKKPLPSALEGIDLVIFDIQDVGARFYTFISTMHYMMEACADHDIPLMILDRPNPNGNYVDGPVLEAEYRSFVGMHPIPVVHGLTVAELAQMINGEGWLENSRTCRLEIVPCKNYTHDSTWVLPVKPSPNLPSQHAIRLYPSTCFFEGTVVSEGRGTRYPFEIFGHPDLPGDFSFVPESIPGMDTHPKFLGKTCYGTDLREFIPGSGWTQLYLQWLVGAYHDFPDKKAFFTPFFDKLAGTDQLRIMIEAGKTPEEIRDSWKADLSQYMSMRDKYLIYK